MLVDMMTGTPITRVPYEQEYRRFMSRLTADEISAAKARLDDLIDGTEIQTAGWMPAGTKPSATCAHTMASPASTSTCSSRSANGASNTAPSGVCRKP